MIDMHAELTAVHRTITTGAVTVLYNLERNDITQLTNEYDVNRGGFVFAQLDGTFSRIDGNYTPTVNTAVAIGFNLTQVGTTLENDDVITIQSTDDPARFVTGTISGRDTIETDTDVFFQLDPSTVSQEATFRENENIRLYRGQLENIVRNEVVDITTINGMFETQPTFTITAQGTTSDVPTFTVTTIQNGVNPDPAGQGVLSTYSVSYAGTQVIAPTELPSGSSALNASTTIRNAVNALTTHTATGNNPFTATSVANSADDLIVTLTDEPVSYTHLTLPTKRIV